MMLTPAATVDCDNYYAISHNISPRNIPSEIWSMIFVHCLTLHPSYNEKPAEEVLRDPRLSPMVLSFVCREWRHIACDTAELWKTCWVNFRHPELNTVWLGRAGTCMLYLYGKRYRETWNVFDWKPLMLSILPFQKRWNSVELEMTNWGTLDFVPVFDAPALQKFKVPMGDQLPFWMFGLIHNSPQIHELGLDRLWTGLPSRLAETNLPFLSTLEISWTSPEEVIQVLAALPQLQHLDVIVEQTDSFPHVSPVTQSNLISLRMDGEFDASIVFDNLILPSLRTFHMLWSFDSRSFTNFIRRSKCQIQELCLGCTDLTDERLITVLQDSSINHFVEKLELSGIGFRITPRLFDFLQYHQNTSPYLPHLTQLSLRESPFRNIPDGLVADVAISRCHRRLCQCDSCSQNPREVHLEHLFIEYLDRETHDLDIARLVPLPEDGPVDLKDVATVIDLTLMGQGPSRIVRNIPRELVR